MTNVYSTSKDVLIVRGHCLCLRCKKLFYNFCSSVDKDSEQFQSQRKLVHDLVNLHWKPNCRNPFRSKENLQDLIDGKKFVIKLGEVAAKLLKEVEAKVVKKQEP